MTKRLLNLDLSVTRLRPKIPANLARWAACKKNAAFSQLDRRIAMMIDLQLASRIPLVE